MESIKRILLITFFKLKYRGNLILGKNIYISKNSTFIGINRIYDNVIFNGRMEGGSYIAKNSTIFGIIGKYSSIGEDVKVLIARHPLNHVSTSPVFYSLAKQAGYTLTDKQLFQEHSYADAKSKYGVIIGHDVWIGSRAIIIGGVKIGNGAVILANSVVTKDVQPYSIVGGTPAKIIKYRFDSKQIEFLLNFKWWDRESAWLKNNINLFSSIADFINEFETNQ